ncbi:MAG: BMP family ABC transporter substrate-binding protein [Inquilinus sp.]|nr:BMP family ABC transporter substrate-binding protein [Inquilinus sp.]
MQSNSLAGRAARLLGLGAGIALLASAALAEPLKVGFVYVGPVGDHGWTYQHDQGRLALEAALGDQVETTYVESVPEGADADRVIRQLAASGHELIFTTSFGYMNPTVRVARSFPNVRFEHATGYQRAPNVSTYAARFYEGRYVVGLVAGRMTKSNVIGYIGSHPIPEVIRGINSFTLALRSVNPEAEVRVVWVNSWYDPGREADAAKALIDQGADIILQHTDSPAPVQAAQERGVWAVGQASDMARFGPDAHLTAIVDIWDAYYIDHTKAAIDGSWTSQDTWGGLADDMLRLSDWNAAIPADVVAEAEAAKAAIMSGELHPFRGPVRNQAGEVVVPAGDIVPDGDLLSMDWYVEGVQGSVPK